TTGGAINFISKKPSDRFDAYASASYSRFDRFEIEGAAGGPISDTFQVRVAAKTTQQSGGWQTNGLTGEKIGDQDRTAVRMQARLIASDNLEILLKGSIFRDKSDQQLREHVGYLAAPFSSTPCQGYLNGVRDP